jgi:hypothetical protein
MTREYHQPSPLVLNIANNFRERQDSLRMHSALTRANALCAYTMSVLASLTFLCFLSTFFNEYQVLLCFPGDKWRVVFSRVADPDPIWIQIQSGSVDPDPGGQI